MDGGRALRAASDVFCGEVFCLSVKVDAYMNMLETLDLLPFILFSAVSQKKQKTYVALEWSEGSAKLGTVNNYGEGKLQNGKLQVRNLLPPPPTSRQ